MVTETRMLKRIRNSYLGNREGLLALDPPHAAAASALRIRPMKTAFVAVTATAIRCHQYVENKVVGHVGAVAAWEWRMLNSLGILTWLDTFMRNALAAGPRAPFADRANGMKAALRVHGPISAGSVLPLNFEFEWALFVIRICIQRLFPP
jgi:hypothetical protein